MFNLNMIGIVPEFMKSKQTNSYSPVGCFCTLLFLTF